VICPSGRLRVIELETMTTSGVMLRVRISYPTSTATYRPRNRRVCAPLRHQHEIDQPERPVLDQRLSRLRRERLIKRFEEVSRGDTGPRSMQGIL